MKKVTKIKGNSHQQLSKKKLRVAAYCRVSTDSDAQLESLEAQKSHYENYISSREDWLFAGLYYDEGVSGIKKEKRPALLQMIADCRAGKIDFIITKSISRFARNTTDCLEMVRKLLELNIPVYFEKENLNTGSMESELFLAILSSIAEGESTSISENNKWAIQKRFQNGTFKLSYPPYGYEWDGEQMIINPDQARIVRWIFTQVLSGKGTQAIANELNSNNIPSKKEVDGLPQQYAVCLPTKNTPVMLFFRKPIRTQASTGTPTTGKEIAMLFPITTRQLSPEKNLKLSAHW